MSTKPRLISFKTCPYVQRSVIVLLEKNIAFDITYIDLNNKPDWFLAISPLGKVPLLQIDNTVLFESAVINEYLDEVYPPAMQPKTPLQRAINRAWIEFGSALIMSFVQIGRAVDETSFNEHKQQCLMKFQHLEKNLSQQPFFNGDTFSLIDAAYAPLFMRIHHLESLYSLGLLKELPKVTAWSKNLLARKSVSASISSDYPDLLLKSIKSRDSFLSKQLLAVS